MQIKDMIPWARKEESPEPKSDDQNPIATLQRDMNRVFEGFWSRAGDLDWPWGGGEAKSDVVETEDAVEISIELPGMEMNLWTPPAQGVSGGSVDGIGCVNLSGL